MPRGPALRESGSIDGTKRSPIVDGRHRKRSVQATAEDSRTSQLLNGQEGSAKQARVNKCDVGAEFGARAEAVNTVR
jgi:hypothetical protein